MTNGVRLLGMTLLWDKERDEPYLALELEGYTVTPWRTGDEAALVSRLGAVLGGYLGRLKVEEAAHSASKRCSTCRTLRQGHTLRWSELAPLDHMRTNWLALC